MSIYLFDGYGGIMSYLNNIFYKHFGIGKMVTNAVTNAAVAGLTGATTGAVMGSMNNISPTDAVNNKVTEINNTISDHNNTISASDKIINDSKSTEIQKTIATADKNKAQMSLDKLKSKVGESGSDTRKAYLDKVAADQKSSNQKKLINSMKIYSGMGAATGAISGAISGAQQDDDEFFSTKFKLMFSEYNKGVN
jgi:uncharacterized membrane protein